MTAAVTALAPPTLIDLLLAEVFYYVRPAEWIFIFLSIVVTASALMVVLTRRLVHAALWMAVTLAALAGCLLVLSAEFLAWVIVLIYVGAVVVLLLFGLMLTRAPTGISTDLNASRTQRWAALVVAAATMGALATAMVQAFGDVRLDLAAATGQRAGGAEAVGTAVFRFWVLPFELLSVLLLAALVGAIVVSRRDEPPAAPVPGQVGEES